MVVHFQQAAELLFLVATEMIKSWSVIMEVKFVLASQQPFHFYNRVQFLVIVP